jgi:hypothetical protein
MLGGLLSLTPSLILVGAVTPVWFSDMPPACQIAHKHPDTQIDTCAHGKPECQIHWILMRAVTPVSSHLTSAVTCHLHWHTCNDTGVLLGAEIWWQVKLYAHQRTPPAARV